jgi:hypothetical protein
MPVLDQIELHLDGTYSNEEAKEFLWASRCCCNYLERALRGVGFKSKYSRLIILCTKDERDVVVRPLEHEPYLEAIVLFHATSPTALNPSAAQKQCMKAIMAGIELARIYTPLPVAECCRALQDFEAGGFVNQWVAREKSWSRLKCRCIIAAEMTMERLTLDQVVYLEGEHVADRRIAETKPREGLYEQYLGAFSSDAKGRILYKAKGGVLTVFDLAKRAFVETPMKKKRTGTPSRSR